jgi:hypothetical protein
VLLVLLVLLPLVVVVRAGDLVVAVGTGSGRSCVLDCFGAGSGLGPCAVA